MVQNGPRGVRSVLTIDEAAARLGVHYMTVYRYIRQGRVTARRESGRWWIDVAALDAMHGFARTTMTKSARPGRREARRRLLARVSEGDVVGAWAILDGAFRAGRPPVDLYVELLGPVLRQVGNEWEAGVRPIESEHRVSAAVMRLVGRIEARGHRAGRRRRSTVLLGGAPGDPHQLPVAMVADALRWEGFDVVDLGANVPAESILRSARTIDDLAAVGISLSVDRHRGAVAKTLGELRNVAPDALLLVGGPAVPNQAAAARLGADGWAPDAGAVADVITAGK